MTKVYVLQRMVERPHSTAGQLLDPDGNHLCAILERGAGGMDRPRIPAGRYPLRMKGAPSKFDERYQKWFGPMFHGMIEVCDVPGRSEILIHTGNKFSDSEGCLLVGLMPPGVVPANGELEIPGGASQPAFRAVYPPLRFAIGQGQVMLEVRDIGSAGAPATQPVPLETEGAER